jgi:hypothetical protein
MRILPVPEWEATSTSIRPCPTIPKMSARHLVGSSGRSSGSGRIRPVRRHRNASTERVHGYRAVQLTERANGLSMLAAIAPEEAVEPLFSALNDSDTHVRTMALVLLLGCDPPSKYGERVVAELGGDDSAAVCFVEHGLGAGSIGSFRLTQRLLPHLDQIARSAARRRDRRRAAFYASQLREHRSGWPLLSETPPKTWLA